VNLKLLELADAERTSFLKRAFPLETTRLRYSVIDEGEVRIEWGGNTPTLKFTSG
jgi:hypothetical protein